MWRFPKPRTTFQVRQFRAKADKLPTIIRYDGDTVLTNTLKLGESPPRQLKLREMQFAMNALLMAGYEPVDVTSMESPDFRIALTSGEQIYVEVTEAIWEHNARRAGALDKVHTRLGAAIERGGPYRFQELGYSILFSMEHAPRAADVSQCVDELARFLQVEDAFSFLRLHAPIFVGHIPEKYEKLNELRTTFYLNGGGRIPCEVSVGEGRLVMPTASKGTEKVIFTRLNDKRAKARKWSARPLWLVIALTDDTWSSEDTVRRVRSRLRSISPFARVFLSGATHVTEISYA
jgi:hypothetical protein